MCKERYAFQNNCSTFLSRTWLGVSEHVIKSQGSIASARTTWWLVTPVCPYSPPAPSLSGSHPVYFLTVSSRILEH